MLDVEIFSVIIRLPENLNLSFATAPISSSKVSNNFSSRLLLSYMTVERRPGWPYMGNMVFFFFSTRLVYKNCWMNVRKNSTLL